MSYIVSNWSNHQWEKYGSKYCGASEPPRPEPSIDYEEIQDYYSHQGYYPDRGQGRASLLLDKTNQMAVIQFRGTDSNLYNILNDLCLEVNSFESLNSLYIHSGFSREYKALKEKFNPLYNRIEDKYKAGWHILITGHSLGGALATLCAADLLLNRAAIKSNRIALITYGSPRVGNKDFAKWIDRAQLKVNLRIEIAGDPIVSLPDQSFGAYVHRGELMQIEPTRTGYEMSTNTTNCGEIVSVEAPWLDNILTRGITSTVTVAGNFLLGCAKALFTLDHRHIPIIRLLVPDGTHSSGSYRNCKRPPEASLTSWDQNLMICVSYPTRIILVECDIGWGNTLYIRRGNAKNLGWKEEEAKEMTCIGKQWKWETTHSPDVNFSFKVLINNIIWQKGPDRPCNHNYNNHERVYKYKARF